MRPWLLRYENAHDADTGRAYRHSQAVNEYKIIVGAALNVGVTPVEIKEILYQSVAYVGMARAFDFVHAANEALTSLETRFRSRRSPAPRRRRGWTKVSRPRRRLLAG